MRKTPDIEDCFGIRVERIVNKSGLSGHRLRNRQVRRSNRQFAERGGSRLALLSAKRRSPIYSQAGLGSNKGTRSISLWSQRPRDLVKPASLPGHGVAVDRCRLFDAGNPNRGAGGVDGE